MILMARGVSLKNGKIEEWDCWKEEKNSPNIKTVKKINLDILPNYETKYKAWLKSNFDAPIPVYPDGVYQGENMFGKRFGEGKMTYTNGDVYEGEWDDDVRAGDGKMTYTNGDIYEGEWGGWCTYWRR